MPTETLNAILAGLQLLPMAEAEPLRGVQFAVDASGELIVTTHSSLPDASKD